MANRQPIFPGTNRLDYKKIYGTADKLIKGLNYNINIIDHIIKQCAASGLSKNQTAVLLSHALAESDFNPLKKNSLGFLGLWLFSKDLWNRFFSKDNSYLNQVKYIITETAKTKDPAKYKGWIQVQNGGNGWVGKHKKTWDQSNNLEAINKAFSFGWERFGDSHVGENNFRYSIAQMFRDYVDTKNFGFNESNDVQNPNEYYMADNIWYEPENTLMLALNIQTYQPIQDLHFENPTLKLYQQGGIIDRNNILMVGDSWGVGMKKYFPNNTSVGSSGLFTRGGLPSAADQIKNSNYSNGVIIVHSGANDIGMRGPKKNGKSLVANDVIQTIKAAKAKGCKIIFVAAPWLNHTSTNVTNNRDKYNSWLKEAAISNGASYIDTSSMLSYMQLHLPTRGNFHLNDYSGYANYILKEAQKLISSTHLQTKQNMSINWKSEKPSKANRWGNPGKEYSNANAMALMNFLTNKGLSIEAAAGIVGNLMSESGLNPYNYVANDNGGPSGGIAMWHNNRLNKLKLFANKRGKAWTDIETQAEYLWHELTEGSYKHVLNKLKNVKTIEDASFIWGDEYEVFAGHQNRNGKNHNTRRNNAINFANLYKSLKPTMLFTTQSTLKTIDANPTEDTQPIDYFGTVNEQFGNEFRENSIEPLYNDTSQDTSKTYVIENPIYGIDYRKAYYDYLNTQKYQRGGITSSKLKIYRDGGDFSYLTSNPLMKKVLSDTSHMCYTRPSINYNNKKMWRAVRGSGATDMRPSPTGKCTNGPATWYRNAGIPIFFWNGALPYTPTHKNYKKGIRSATVADMKAPLIKAGFQIVWSGTGLQANSQLQSSGILRPGDIATMLSSNSAHAAMWTGKDWRSDFVQKKAYPYSSIGRGGNETFILWRRPDLQDNKPLSTIKFTLLNITDNKENTSNNASTSTAKQTYVLPENNNYLDMNNQIDTKPNYPPSDEKLENIRKKYSIENSIQGVDYRKAYYNYLNKRYLDGGLIFKPVQSDVLGIFKIKNTNPLKLPSKTLDFAKIIQRYLDSNSKIYLGLLNVYGDTFKGGGKFRMGHPEDINYEDDIYYNPPIESSNKKYDLNDWNTIYDEVYYDPSTEDKSPTEEKVVKVLGDPPKTESKEDKSPVIIINDYRDKLPVSKELDAYLESTKNSLNNNYLSFAQAFRLARNSGLKTFTWRGKVYTTLLAKKTSRRKYYRYKKNKHR